MTSDNDHLTEMDELQPTDAEIEAILGAGQPSGDAAVDDALEALREFALGDAPPPSPELRALVGPALAAVSSASARVARSGRHVATGSATLAGLLLASATAAAAIGVHQATTSEPRPADHRSTSTPAPSTHPTGRAAEPTGPATGPTGLPPIVVPADRLRTVAPGLASATHREDSTRPRPERSDAKEHSTASGSDSGESGDSGDPGDSRNESATTPTSPTRPRPTSTDGGDDHQGGGVSGGSGDSGGSAGPGGTLAGD